MLDAATRVDIQAIVSSAVVSDSLERTLLLQQAIDSFMLPHGDCDA